MKIRKVKGKNGRIKIQDVRTGRFMGELPTKNKISAFKKVFKAKTSLRNNNIPNIDYAKSSISDLYSKFADTEHFRTVSVIAEIIGVPKDKVLSSYHDLLQENKNVDAPEVTEDDIDLYFEYLEKNYPDRLDVISRLEVSTDPNTFDALVQLPRRCTQQCMIEKVEGIIKLSSPKANMEEYELDASGQPPKVIYASYGSNLYSERLNLYITGGKLNGTSREYEGCRNPQLPTDVLPLALNGTVYYAGKSSVWRGGVAFLDTTTKGKAFGKGVVVTKEQFDDIVAQENRCIPGSYEIDVTTVLREGHLNIGGAYGNLVHVGDYNNIPVLTFTGSFTTNDAKRGDLMVSTKTGNLVSVEEEQYPSYIPKSVREKLPPLTGNNWYVYSNRPTDNYLDMIRGGLKETFPSLNDRQIAQYFSGAS